MCHFCAFLQDFFLITTLPFFFTPTFITKKTGVMHKLLHLHITPILLTTYFLLPVYITACRLCIRNGIGMVVSTLPYDISALIFFNRFELDLTSRF